MIILGLPTEYHGKDWYHLGSTESLEELQAFARQIGLQREWLQLAGSHPHYDVMNLSLNRARRAGAVEVNRREYIRDVFRGK